MTDWQSKGLLSLIYLLSVGTLGQSLPKAMLTPSSQAQQSDAYSQIDLSLLPKGATLDNPPSKQVFTLKAQGAPDLLVIPILFWGDRLLPNFQCGTYFVTDKNVRYYVSAIGPNFIGGSQDCDVVIAAGTMTDSGSRPRLIFIFKARAMGGNHYNVPFVFSWDERTMRYHLDQTATASVQDDKSYPETVAATRAVLARKLPKL